MNYNGKYIPEKKDLYKISRSKIEFYLNCPRCFYLDRKLGIKRPSSFPYTLNSAVDNLLKNEFDHYRIQKNPHPYINKIGINAIPFNHEKLDEWRYNFKGITYDHPSLGFHIFGAVDDIWLNLDTNELIVVDYKATSKSTKISLDAEWQAGYKRQIEIYQYLLRKNKFKVSDIGYFVYCNGIKNKNRFDEKIDFEVSIIDYSGSDDWVENELINIYKLLNQSEIPAYTKGCDFCNYNQKVNSIKYKQLRISYG